MPCAGDGRGLAGTWESARRGLGESRDEGETVAAWKERIALKSLRKDSLASVGAGRYQVGDLQEPVPWARCPFGAL